MKFLTNSKILHSALAQADFEKVHVADVSLEQNILSITFSDYETVEVVVGSLEGSSNVSQPNVRWDLVFKTLGQVGDQSVVVSLKGSGLTLAFEY